MKTTEDAVERQVKFPILSLDEACEVMPQTFTNPNTKRQNKFTGWRRIEAGERHICIGLAKSIMKRIITQYPPNDDFDIQVLSMISKESFNNFFWKNVPKALRSRVARTGFDYIVLFGIGNCKELDVGKLIPLISTGGSFKKYFSPIMQSTIIRHVEYQADFWDDKYESVITGFDKRPLVVASVLKDDELYYVHALSGLSIFNAVEPNFTDPCARFSENILLKSIYYENYIAASSWRDSRIDLGVPGEMLNYPRKKASVDTLAVFTRTDIDALVDFEVEPGFSEIKLFALRKPYTYYMSTDSLRALLNCCHSLQEELTTTLNLFNAVCELAKFFPDENVVATVKIGSHNYMIKIPFSCKIAVFNAEFSWTEGDNYVTNQGIYDANGYYIHFMKSPGDVLGVVGKAERNDRFMELKRDGYRFVWSFGLGTFGSVSEKASVLLYELNYLEGKVDFRKVIANLGVDGVFSKPARKGVARNLIAEIATRIKNLLSDYVLFVVVELDGKKYILDDGGSPMFFNLDYHPDDDIFGDYDMKWQVDITYDKYDAGGREWPLRGMLGPNKRHSSEQLWNKYMKKSGSKSKKGAKPKT